MKKINRARVAVVLTLIAVAGLTTGLSTPANATPEQFRYHKYVALGDSGPAGPALGRTQMIPCGRGENSYPKVLSEKLIHDKLLDASDSFFNESCSGATTATMDSQLQSVDSDTDLVTAMIGANDLGNAYKFKNLHDGIIRLPGTVTAECLKKYKQDACGFSAAQLKELKGLKDDIKKMIVNISDRAAEDAAILIADHPVASTNLDPQHGWDEPSCAMDPPLVNKFMRLLNGLVGTAVEEAEKDIKKKRQDQVVQFVDLSRSSEYDAEDSICGTTPWRAPTDLSSVLGQVLGYLLGTSENGVSFHLTSHGADEVAKIHEDSLPLRIP